MVEFYCLVRSIRVRVLTLLTLCRFILFIYDAKICQLKLQGAIRLQSGIIRQDGPGPAC